jgi:hypothetical protein
MSEQYLKEKVFETLSKINVNDKVEKKNGLTYLSWAWAWSVLKEKFPTSTYTIYENKDGWNYFTDGRTAWVKTGVSVLGVEHIEYLPVMDFRNKSIALDQVTSFDVNKAIQRSMTKAISRHGLGSYIYQGEDLPSDSDGVVGDRETKPSEVIVAGGQTEPIRKTTVAVLNSFIEKLNAEDKAKVTLFLAKLQLTKVEDLTEAQGRALLINIQKKGV